MRKSYCIIIILVTRSACNKGLIAFPLTKVLYLLMITLHQAIVVWYGIGMVWAQNFTTF